MAVVVTPHLGTAGAPRHRCGDDAEGPAEEPEVATEEVTENVGDDAAAGEAEPMDVGEILADPSAFAGEDVTFEGQVDEALTDGLFTVSATDASTDPLLVATTDGASVGEGADVTVQGTLAESFSVEDAEEFLGSELDDAQFERFTDEPFVEAETVE